MAAVYSEPVTDNYFPKMGRGDDQTSSASPSYRQPSSSRTRAPPSPRFQPTDSTASKISADTSSNPPQPASTARAEDGSLGKTFASQQNFANVVSNSSVPHNIPQPSSAHPELNPPGSAPLLSPADSGSPIARSAWSSDDVSKYGGATIKVRDLSHIQSFASEEFLQHRGNYGRRARTEDEQPLKYEISAMPIADIIEMVAGLLTKITTTNDRQHENLHRPIPSAEVASTMPGLTSSVLAFHGKNVPSITILSYLSRIHKYCPTTYEVFLSLLVYFDRMTERVNAGPMKEMRRASYDKSSRPSTGAQSTSDESSGSRPSSGIPISGRAEEMSNPSHYATPPDEHQLPYLSHFFVVDSFNIHRLVIAGVTCASKFFSDVFYTNSRYAKVGGLPLAELNHLELQFLLLNDFRLSVPVEELEAYGTMLVEFYAREVIAQRQASELPSDLADSDDEDTPMT